jgi:predicted peroxiredoxin
LGRSIGLNKKEVGNGDITAVGALGAGKEVGIALLGEGAYLAKEVVAKSVHGVGFSPLPEYIDKVVKGNVPVYV